MIFGKRPPRATRRHLETEAMAAAPGPSDDDIGPMVIRTPSMKPFARPPAPAAKAAPAPRPATPKPAAKPQSAVIPRAAAAAAPAKMPPHPAKAVARPNPRGVLPDSHQVPGHTLVVGRDIRLTGEISACERLIVEGSVEAELTDTRTLEIAGTGHFRGSAAVGNCVVSGSFDGDLTVSGLLAVRAGGRVGGAIRYAEIEVERGGRITGSADLRSADLQGPQEVRNARDPNNGPGLRPA